MRSVRRWEGPACRRETCRFTGLFKTIVRAGRRHERRGRRFAPRWPGVHHEERTETVFSTTGVHREGARHAARTLSTLREHHVDNSAVRAAKPRFLRPDEGSGAGERLCYTRAPLWSPSLTGCSPTGRPRSSLRSRLQAPRPPFSTHHLTHRPHLAGFLMSPPAAAPPVSPSTMPSRRRRGS